MARRLCPNQGTGLLIAAATEAANRGDASVTRSLFAGFASLGVVSYLPLILATMTYALAVQRTGVLPR